MVVCDQKNIEQVKKQLSSCLQLLEHYEWLINSFVLDFFIDSHWKHLPSSWKDVLTNITPHDLADWLDHKETPKYKEPWPLSLLALKQTIKHLSLDRAPVKNLTNVESFLKMPETPQSWEFEPELLSESGGQHAILKHVFRKHVKPKKQYEMCRLAKLTSSVSKSMSIDKVLDIGSGVGHLSRYLCYNNKLQVACVDGDDKLTNSAKKFDEQLEFTVDKMLKRGDTSLQLPRAPVHVTSHIAPDMNLDKFHQILTDKFSISNPEELKYGILGLHTCGDLGPVLIKMFTQDPGSVMLNSIGCCYMKIQEHFPMSSFVEDQDWHKLTYTSNELACHALEMYTDRLRKEQEDKLKVHCYRAMLEKLLLGRNESFRHTILKTVARAHEMTFVDYVTKATTNLVNSGNLEAFSIEELTDPKIDAQLEQWWEVVTFYTLRLAMAPIIETVILLDRCIFLYENGIDNMMIPLFDPIMSPRNQVIVAVKKG